jgi:capsid protein
VLLDPRGRRLLGGGRRADGRVAGPNNGTADNGILNVGMEPGSLIPLPPGADIQFSDPGDYGAFVKNHVRAIAAGLGVPYELASGDLEGVTYSSIPPPAFWNFAGASSSYNKWDWVDR